MFFIDVSFPGLDLAPVVRLPRTLQYSGIGLVVQRRDVAHGLGVAAQDRVPEVA